MENLYIPRCPKCSRPMILNNHSEHWVRTCRCDEDSGEKRFTQKYDGENEAGAREPWPKRYS
jgi:hypothetical protein